MNRRLFSLMLVATAFAAEAQTPPQPKALIYYAGQPGRLTQDRDKLGGNPFASALVEVLAKHPENLEQFTQSLAASNARHSGGWQQLQFPRKLPKWKMDQPAGKRVALVLINADYSKTNGVYSLPGAAFDAKRIPAALKEAGFETTLVLDANADTAREAMAAFSKLSESAEASVIYVGGHGMQHKRTVYWMAGDYPEQNPKWLDSHAIRLDEISRVGHARDVNLVLYASCRDDPFS
ncbi:MAG TPA: caspase family protein [Hyphomonadaceae bacterium]|nr:caspase family protein [Hyphomonadaceae bacterium]HPN06324.1 caspase family protein [Hyphomonadaceae bacterium]